MSHQADAAGSQASQPQAGSDAWPRLDPGEAPPSGLGAPFPGEAAEGIIGYQVDGDWRRGPDGRWFRWYRAEYADGRHAIGMATSPLSASLQLEEHTIGPYCSLWFVGIPLAVGTAVVLVVSDAVEPLSAVAGAVVGVAGVTVAWTAFDGLVRTVVPRWEAPGNATWRHAPKALRASGLLWFMPAVTTAAVAIALTRMRSG